MNIKYLTEQEANNILNAMASHEDEQNEPSVGPFWVDTNTNELYGVVKSLAKDCPCYKSTIFDSEVRTSSALHKAIWKKQSLRGKDKRFSGDYRLKPRGRVFEVKDKGFIICVGSWINNHPEAIDEIKFEFDLPDENTEIVINDHWDLGHGWSQEL